MLEAGPRSFQTTRWSLVLAAGGGQDSLSLEALDELCRLYWYPVYAFVRRTSKSAEDAHDLTQGFFTDLLARKHVAKADAGRGRFRSWLLACAKNYLANRHDYETAEKRGGGHVPLSIDATDAEGRYVLEPVEGTTPEKLYFRRWALTVLDRVLADLRDEKVREGKAERFDALRPYLLDEGSESYEELGVRLSLKANAVKQAVHQLQRTFDERLRLEIAGTLNSGEDIDDEIRQLLKELE